MLKESLTRPRYFKDPEKLMCLSVTCEKAHMGGTNRCLHNVYFNVSMCSMKMHI